MAEDSNLNNLETAVKNVESGFIAKQEGWIKTHAIPLLIGAACGMLLGYFIGHVL